MIWPAARTSDSSMTTMPDARAPVWIMASIQSLLRVGTFEPEKKMCRGTPLSTHTV